MIIDNFPGYIGSSSAGIPAAIIMTNLSCPSNSSMSGQIYGSPKKDKYWTNHIYNSELGQEGHEKKISKVRDPSHTVEFCDGALNTFCISLGAIDHSDAINT